MGIFEKFNNEIIIYYTGNCTVYGSFPLKNSKTVVYILIDSYTTTYNSGTEFFRFLSKESDSCKNLLKKVYCKEHICLSLGKNKKLENSFGNNLENKQPK